MNKGLLKKTIIVLGVSLLALSLFVGCGNKEEELKTEAVVNEVESEKQEETTEEKPEEKKEEAEKEEKEEANTEASTSVGTGVFYAEAMPMFEELYAADEQKDFKIEFAKKALDTMDQVGALLPQNLQEELFTSEGLVEFEGPVYTYNFQASQKPESPSKTNNFEGVFGELNFADDKEYLYCDSQISLSFATGSDTELVLSEEAKEMIKLLIPEYTPEEIEVLLNESLAKNGETNYLVEEKNYSVTLSSNVYEGNTSATVHVETRKDYP